MFVTIGRRRLDSAMRYIEGMLSKMEGGVEESNAEILVEFNEAK